MTASLNQSASSTSSPDGVAGSFAADWATSFIATSASQEVVEIVLGAQVPPQLQDVRRHAPGIEHYVIAAAAPLVALVAQQIVHLVGRRLVESERRQVELDPARLYVMGIEVDHHDDHVVGGSIALQIPDELLIIERTEAQRRIRLQ